MNSCFSTPEIRASETILFTVRPPHGDKYNCKQKDGATCKEQDIRYGKAVYGSVKPFCRKIDAFGIFYCLGSREQSIVYFFFVFYESFNSEAQGKYSQDEYKGKYRLDDILFPERYCHAYHGSYMSFVTTPYGKQIKMKGRLKGIKNLYVAGQWTNSPGGLPVAAASGKFAVQRILKKLHRNIEI